MACGWRWTVVMAGVLAASLPGAGAAEAPVLTLADCLRVGVERSLTLANAHRDQAIAGEDIRQVRAQALPSLTAEAGYTWIDDPLGFPGAGGEAEPQDEQYRASLRAEQLLYSGGAVRAALDAARHYRDSADAVAGGALRELTRAVAERFYVVLQTEAAVVVSEASLQLLEGYAAQTAQKLARGLASEFDHLTAQVRVANQRPLVAVARNDFELARSALRTLLNLEGEVYTFVGTLTAPTNAAVLDALYAQAFAQRPELAVAEAEIRFYDARVRVERSDYLPELRAFATYLGDHPNLYEPTADEWTWGWQAGASASWNLLDGGLRSGRTRAVALRREKAEATRDALRNEIRLQVQQAHLTLVAARETLRGSAEAVRLATRALAIAQTRVDQGMATYLELTDGNVALSRARLVQLNALTACRQAWIQLQYAAGGDVVAAATEEGSVDE